MASSNPTSSAGMERLLALVIMLSGLCMAAPGAYLLQVGGTPYYLVAGTALIVSGLMLWRGSAHGAWLYALVLAGTIAWSLWESGLDAWALLPRVGLLLGLGWLVLLARALRVSRKRMARVLMGSAAVAGVAAVAGGIAWRGPARSDLFADAIAAPQNEGEWHSIGGGQGSQRFSPLGQITPANVSGLRVAWKIHLGMPPAGMYGSLEATPLKVGDTLFMCNMHNVVSAIDAETGQKRWEADPQIDRKGVALAACRGVSYYRDATADPKAPCAERIIQTAYDARIIALDLHTGKRCEGFGNGGAVDLRAGIGPIPKGYYYLTSPAAVVRDRLVVGASVLDGQEVNEPSGVIRAFDARTGAFVWAWDMGRPGDHGMPPKGETFTRGTPNAWAPITGDDQSGLVFVPLGNATPDYLAAHRSEPMNRYSSSIVALDIATGDVRWSYQTTHRDVWDYDVASPPTLADFPMPDGSMRPAVIQATKRGQIFVLDRLTGKSLVDTVEKAVPQNAVPGEKLSPTQPYPVGMPSLGGGLLTEARMWGISPFDQLWCRIRFRQARYDGDFTPMTTKPTIVFPSYFGGSNWSGVSVDPQRGLLAVNVNYFAMYNRLIPRPEANAKGIYPFRVGHNELDIAAWPQGGTGYAAKTGGFLSPIGVPCTQPPFGELAVIDLKTRKIAWRTPLGTARDSGPAGMALGLPIPLGTPALGGSLMTRSGLLFIAATQERMFRAFDSATGKLLWQDRLPAGGHANPMTYYSDRSGRQFVVIAASGHPQLASGSGDTLIAYALPKRR
ncbi:membrane-bound PQQ-dependent dehydrogenase, glucose/quinate/shikimate family [Novosphingobium sp. KCTC 2891]|uniref:membrane-bound PQQ-dependent dehydrogenase, glucose/quinate/shikimate family n=1 Tax=Novosphingobium sp. KCTC 2891 TaxID=2989730 RepID=UPI0022234F43|nr:membrane-bound PQQ-dependent dehydrogenase, glucose/quinate/shikimate family [Novosphingobium sp. KCTC 2891]MCW1385026.1 membrane-bound PQQ-dependent dehydrogenase, glucose/quinate/shikimate family [Novosphingobium sp. KCTC 2891]